MVSAVDVHGRNKGVNITLQIERREGWVEELEGGGCCDKEQAVMNRKTGGNTDDDDGAGMDGSNCV